VGSARRTAAGRELLSVADLTRYARWRSVLVDGNIRYAVACPTHAHRRARLRLTVVEYAPAPRPIGWCRRRGSALLRGRGHAHRGRRPTWPATSCAPHRFCPTTRSSEGRTADDVSSGARGRQAPEATTRKERRSHERRGLQPAGSAPGPRAMPQALVDALDFVSRAASPALRATPPGVGLARAPAAAPLQYATTCRHLDARPAPAPRAAVPSTCPADADDLDRLTSAVDGLRIDRR